MSQAIQNIPSDGNVKFLFQIAPKDLKLLRSWDHPLLKKEGFNDLLNEGSFDEEDMSTEKFEAVCKKFGADHTKLSGGGQSVDSDDDKDIFQDPQRNRKKVKSYQKSDKQTDSLKESPYFASAILRRQSVRVAMKNSKDSFVAPLRPKTVLKYDDV